MRVLGAHRLPLVTAAWTIAVFFPAVRYGRLYSFISDRRNERLGYALRLAHWYNFYSPIIIATLWFRYFDTNNDDILVIFDENC